MKPSIGETQFHERDQGNETQYCMERPSFMNGIREMKPSIGETQFHERDQGNET